MEQETSVRVVLDWLARLEVGNVLAHRQMTIFPLRPAPGRSGSSLLYHTLAEAIAAGAVEVRERPSASVPELVLCNRGQTMVFVLDGEEIVGGKQNRIANASFLVAAGTEVLLPVSCVEHGRWHDVSATFAPGEASPLSLKREKHAQVRASLRASGRPEADQGAIWEHVARREAQFGRRSPTGAMHDVYKSLGDDLAAYERAFPHPEGAVGLLVALHGRLAGGDLFDQPRTAQALWTKLVRSYALDALGGETGGSVERERAVRFLGRFRGARGEVYPSLALGEDVRLDGNGAVGAALVYQGTPVHVSLFRMRGEAAQPSGRMASASLRRAMRRDPRLF